MREHVVPVRLSAAELHDLDLIARERSQTRSAVLRSALTTRRSDLTGPISYEHVLELLAGQAEAGKVDAIVALARHLSRVR